MLLLFMLYKHFKQIIMNSLLKLLNSKEIAASVTAFFLMMCTAVSQERETTQADGFSKQETYAWYAQPWVWALAAGIIVMVIFVITKGGRKSHMEPDSEEGTVHE